MRHQHHYNGNPNPVTYHQLLHQNRVDHRLWYRICKSYSDGHRPPQAQVAQGADIRPPTTHTSIVQPVAETVPTEKTLMAPHTPIQPSVTVASGSLQSASPSPLQTQVWSPGPSQATSTSLGLATIMTMPSKSGVSKILSWTYKEVSLFEIWCRDQQINSVSQGRMDYHQPAKPSRCYFTARRASQQQP